MKTHKLLPLSALLLLQTNLFATQSDTLNLDEVMLKSALINQANPALTVSEISYDEIYDPIEPINRAVLNFNFFIDDVCI